MLIQNCVNCDRRLSKTGERAGPFLRFCATKECGRVRGRVRSTARALPPIPCAHCGGRTSNRGPRSADGTRFCKKPDCERARNRKRQKEFVAKKKSEGVDVYAPYRARQRESLRARIETGETLKQRQNPKYRERIQAADQLRRALKAGAESEKFTSLEVFDRDGWICGICKQRVDKDEPYPDPASPSLDHVIPLSLGGAHTRANTQCTHLICNLRKGARVQVA